MDYSTFFDIFSQFLAVLCNRCSKYVNITAFRPPWPSYLVELARLVNKHKRKFRCARFSGDYKSYKYVQNNYTLEKINYE